MLAHAVRRKPRERETPGSWRWRPRASSLHRHKQAKAKVGGVAEGWNWKHDEFGEFDLQEHANAALIS